MTNEQINKVLNEALVEKVIKLATEVGELKTLNKKMNQTIYYLETKISNSGIK